MRAGGPPHEANARGGAAAPNGVPAERHGRTWWRYPAQALLYAAFALFIAYFSTSPRYQHLAPGEALVKLSLTHAGERRQACRERTPEELAKLAPNMRAQTVCPRERAPVSVEVTVDGEPLMSVKAPPSGLASDGPSTVYRRAPIAAGSHRFTARLADAPDGAFRYAGEATVDLAAGHVLVIDFDPARGGFVFRT